MTVTVFPVFRRRRAARDGMKRETKAPGIEPLSSWTHVPSAKASRFGAESRRPNRRRPQDVEGRGNDLMMIRMLALSGCAIAVMTALAPAPPARAANFNAGSFGGGFSTRSFGKTQICLPSKPMVANKTFTFNKSITINKPITIEKNITIQKNIDLSKHIDINKSIVINKGSDNGQAVAAAIAVAQASASASASAFSYARGGSAYVTVVNNGGGGGISQIAVAPPEQPCVQQPASVIKAIHAECIDAVGEHHAAVRMRPETWIDSSEAKEIFRCLEGSKLFVTVGDVVQSDKGLAGIYEGAETLVCKNGEALRHFKDGLVKCAVAEKVPDCTERTNMRKYGLGDVFFTFQTQVCARPAMAGGGGASYDPGYSPGYSYAPSPGEIQLSGMTLDGGVGQ
jgi:hypothetical protein